MVQFQYWFRDGRTGMVDADNPQQVLDNIFKEFNARLRNDSHVDFSNYRKHFGVGDHGVGTFPMTF